MILGRSSANSHNFAILCTKLSLFLLFINFILISTLLMHWSHTATVAGGSSPVTTVAEEKNGVDSEQKSSESTVVKNVMSSWKREKVYDFKFKDKSAIYQMLHKTNIEEAAGTTPNVPLMIYTNNGKPELQILRDKSLERTHSIKHVNEYALQKDKDSASLSPSDIHFSVRTTPEYHQLRLKFMIDTWISLIPEEVTIFTENIDPTLQNLLENLGKRRPEPVMVDCPFRTDSKWALLCKLYWEFKSYFLRADKKKWFCHFDDDTYVNVPNLLAMLDNFDSEKYVYIGHASSDLQPLITRVYKPQVFSKKLSYINEQEHNHSDPYHFVSFHFALAEAGYCISNQLVNRMMPFFQGPSLIQTAASITLPDDCVIGYVITHLLNVSLIHSELMYSHANDVLSEKDLFNLVTVNVRFKESYVQEDVKENDTENTLSDNNTAYLNGTKVSKTEENSNFEVVRQLHETLIKHLHR